MVKVLFCLFIAFPLFANSCADNANGVASAPASWTSCGGTFPHNGDSISITSHTITQDIDLGSTGGGGILGIAISSTGHLVEDGVSAHAIYFASTGSTPGTDMYGVTISGGTPSFDTSANTATTPLTLVSANSTFPFFIWHNNSLGAGGTVTINLHYVILTNCGIGGHFASHNCVDDGTRDGDLGSHRVTVDHCIFNGGAGDITVGLSGTEASGFPKITNNTWVGRTSSAIYTYGSLSSSVKQITDNTDYLSASSTVLWQQDFNAIDSVQLLRNAIYGPAGLSGGLVRATNMDSTAGNSLLQYNVIDFNAAQAGNSDSTGFQANASVDHTVQIDKNICQNTYQCISISAGSPTAQVQVFSGNWASSVAAAAPGQGMIAVQNGGNTNPFAASGNMFNFPVTDISHVLISIFSWDGGVMTASRNTTAGTSSFSQGITAGDGSILPAGPGMMALNNIDVNGQQGVTNNHDTQTWGTGGTASVGVSNNDTFGLVTPYSDAYAGVVNFGTGHPSATYGDLTVNPGLIAPHRSIAGFDAYLGGPGTDAHFMQEMAARSGLTGISGLAGGLTYDPRYTPEALYGYLQAGFAPLNLTLAKTASDGGVVGAVTPIVMGAWAQ